MWIHFPDLEDLDQDDHRHAPGRARATARAGGLIKHSEAAARMGIHTADVNNAVNNGEMHQQEQAGRMYVIEATAKAWAAKHGYPWKDSKEQ
jgi:hypothetical protein